MRKQCSRCKKSRLIKFFSRDARRKDGLQHRCKDCQSQLSRSHYEKNKPVYKLRESTKKQGGKKLIRSLKAGPCVDCELSYPYCIMHFDHVRGDKTASLSKMCSYGSERIMEEIAKCELVCSNCHADRTYSRMCATRNPRSG